PYTPPAKLRTVPHFPTASRLMALNGGTVPPASRRRGPWSSPAPIFAPVRGRRPVGAGRIRGLAPTAIHIGPLSGTGCGVCEGVAGSHDVTACVVLRLACGVSIGAWPLVEAGRPRARLAWVSTSGSCALRWGVHIFLAGTRERGRTCTGWKPVSH